MPGSESLYRWLLVIVLVANLSTSAFFRFRARRATGTIPRTRERSGLLAARMLVGIPMWFLIVGYAFGSEWLTWTTVELPEWSRWLGFGLGLSALPLVFWTLKTLGSNVTETTLVKEKHTLVTGGPYRWVRHPLYTSAGLVLLPGIALLTKSWLLAVVIVVVMGGIYWFIVPAEEAALEAKFGEHYRDYRSATGALLPKI